MPRFYRSRYRRYRPRQSRNFRRRPYGRTFRRRRIGTRRRMAFRRRTNGVGRQISVIRKLEVRVPDVDFNTVQRITIAASEFEGLDPYFELYSQFRIKKAIVRFIPDQNVNTSVFDGTDVVIDNLPTIISAPLRNVGDFFQGTVTVPDLRSYYRSREQRYNRVHTRSFVPYIELADQVTVDAVTVQTLNRNLYTPWLSTNVNPVSPQNVPQELSHNGLIWGLSAPAQIGVDDPYGNVEYVITGVFEFKDPKPAQ